MAPIIDIESKDHLDDLVKNREKIVLCCLPRPPQHLGSDSSNIASNRDHPAALHFIDLAQRLQTVAPCRVYETNHSNLGPVLAESLTEGEERLNENRWETGWVFYRASTKVMHTIEFQSRFCHGLLYCILCTKGAQRSIDCYALQG